MSKLINNIEAALIAGQSVRIRYRTSDKTLENAINYLIEYVGARVTCEDPWGEPPWVELELVRSSPSLSA
jgi:hypothetical protein